MGPRLNWYWRRLAQMSLPEIGARITGLARTYMERAGIGLATNVPPERSDITPGAGWVRIDVNLDPDPYVIAARKILAGSWSIFALKDIQLGFPPDWNLDCRTGVRAPLVFGKMLNYRDERLVGNIKYLWEPSRHLELVTLCQAYALTGKDEFADGARVFLDSWFDAAPYPLGPHWTSSLELAVRLVNWSVAWQLLGGDESTALHGNQGTRFRERWLQQIYRHCHFIGRHLSKFSSANNHLLGEYMGLFVATTTWPLWRESEHWNLLAKRGFEKEALLQNFPDGANREQAIWYHHEVMDMMVICGLAARATGEDFGTEYWKRLEAMTEYILAAADTSGNVPMLGDSDDAVMVRFSPTDGFNVYRSLLATGATLFGRADFKAQAAAFDAKSQWLLGTEGRRRFDSLDASVRIDFRREFPDAGLYVMGCDFGKPTEIKILADAGPLGYLSIAAHGHADALSLTLSAYGQEILIDPGTYAYHTERKWRDYFRGTLAHNTVRIDGVDQSVIGGNFMWLAKASAFCERRDLSGAEQVLSIGHDGYARLADPVIHRRKLVLSTADRRIEITDFLECQQPHGVEVCWHFHESFHPVVSGNTVIARGEGVVATMEMVSGSLVPVLLRGVEDPPAGWVSRRFDAKQACTTVIWKGSASPGEALQTRIRVGLTDGGSAAASPGSSASRASPVGIAMGQG